MNKVDYKRLRKAVKLRFYSLLTIISPTLNSKVVYRDRMGRKLVLDPPTTLNEKLMWLKLYRYNSSELVCKCCDKVAVREYVIEKGCEKYLTQAYGVYDDPDDIEWDKMPDSFVIKWNYGSGYNLFCRDKSVFNKEEAVKKLKTWKKRGKYWLRYSELQYENMPPKILIEEMIQTSDGLPPRDYKIFCSYGIPKLLFVASERINNRTKFDYYYPDWTWIPVKNAHPNAGDILPRPAELDEMLQVASKLAEDFPIARLDLYLEIGKIYFGELTFSHFSCRTPFDPDEYDRIFGDLFPIERELSAGKNRTRPRKKRDKIFER